MAKPDPYAVQRLMREYPRLDYLMAFTLLSFTEEELERFMREADEKKAKETTIPEGDEEPNAGDAGHDDHQAADQ